MLTAGAGCWGYVPADSNGTTTGGENGVREVDVANCSPETPQFPNGEQFTVFAKPAAAAAWQPKGQLQANCAVGAQIQLDQPGQWVVRAIGILPEEYGACNSYDGEGMGCSDKRDALYQQNPEGPVFLEKIQ